MVVLIVFYIFGGIYLGFIEVSFVEMEGLFVLFLIGRV